MEVSVRFRSGTVGSLLDIETQYIETCFDEERYQPFLLRKKDNETSEIMEDKEEHKKIGKRHKIYGKTTKYYDKGYENYEDEIYEEGDQETTDIVNSCFDWS